MSTEVITSPSLEVPVLPAPVAQPTVDVDIPNSIPAEKISVAKSLGLPTEGPLEALGENPEEAVEEIDRWAGKAARERGPDGKFIPKAKPEAVKAEVPKPKPEVKPEPKVAPKAQEATKPAKVKIGDEELTPDEIKARMDELRAKAEPKVEAKIETPKVEQTPEQIAAEEKAKDSKFLETRAADYTLSQDDFDKMLATGDPKVLAGMFAKVEMNARKFFANAVNPQLEKLTQSLSPVLKTHEQVQQFQTQNQFLNSNPDIKGHPEGIKTMETVQSELRREESVLKRLAIAGTADADELATLKRYETISPEEFSAVVAQNTRQRLGLGAPETRPEVTTAPPAAKAEPKPPVEQPRNGDRPGGAGKPPKVQSDEASLAAEIAAM